MTGMVGNFQGIKLLQVALLQKTTKVLYQWVELCNLPTISFSMSRLVVICWFYNKVFILQTDAAII